MFLKSFAKTPNYKILQKHSFHPLKSVPVENKMSYATSQFKKKPSIYIPPQNFKADVKHTATLKIAPWMIPHDEKRSKGGEDSYFISKDGTVFGVFDGVGGWIESGVDPKEYSYHLSEECRKAVDTEFLTDPLDILKYGWDRSTHVVGSCTACIVAINGKYMEALNVGDSGFRVIRDFNLVCASKEQQHTFNMPFQLGTMSEDRPHHGDRYTFTLQDGDTIVMGTDGLFDNMDTNSLLQLMKSHQTEQNIQNIAELIAREAYIISKNHRAHTPFAQSAIKNGYYDFLGGKEDDITVVAIRYQEMHAKL